MADETSGSRPPQRAGDPTTGPAEPPPATVELARFDPKLVEILVCPITRTTLSYDAARQELVSRAARLAFPIRDGLPILVREEARSLDANTSPSPRATASDWSACAATSPARRSPPRA